MSPIRVGALVMMLAMVGSPALGEPKRLSTDPHGGVTVALGPYTGEFRVWERFLELFV
jgi:hypothetical protein